MADQIDLKATLPDNRPTLSVLFLADHFAYFGGVTHGVTSYYINVLPALVAAGVKVTACFLRDPPRSIQALQALGIEVISLRSSRWSLAVFAKVVRLLRSGKYNVIHAAQVKASMAARIACRVCDIPLVIHVHDEYVAAWPIRLVNKLFARDTDVGLCVSTAAGDCATRGYQIAPQQQIVLHSGLQLKPIRRPHEHRKRLRGDLLNIPDNRPVVGMVARFFEIKGHRTFIAALPDFLKQVPDVQFVFVGDGPERMACEALANELGVANHTTFLRQRTDVAELLNCFDALVVPSLSEGLPLVAIEGLAAGLPLVGFDVGGVKEVLTDGVTGFLAPPGDMKQFMASLANLITDSELKRTMSLAALADAQRFSASWHVENLVKIYISLHRQTDDAAAVKTI